MCVREIKITSISLWPLRGKGSTSNMRGLICMFTGYRICKNTRTDLFVSKNPNNWTFSLWVHFEAGTLEYQKEICFQTFGLFGTRYEKICPSFLSATHLWASFYAKCGHKDNSFIQVTKYDKNDPAPQSIFLTIKN